MSESRLSLPQPTHNTNDDYRQNPTVLQKASQCFTYIAQALEAETLQGQMAQRIIGAGKKLIQISGLDAQGLLNQLPPETQTTVRALFG